MNKGVLYFNTLPHRVISWIFAGIFLIIGILNLIFVHPIPAICYGMLSLAYLPMTNRWVYGNLGFAFPLWIKVLLGLIVLWATLGVGDLMEVYEAWLREV